MTILPTQEHSKNEISTEIIVHWFACRGDDTHTEPADNSYQLQNWNFLVSLSPDEYSYRDRQCVFNPFPFLCTHTPKWSFGRCTIMERVLPLKSAPCLSIGIIDCDCRNFRVSGILRKADNELCPNNLCPYVFIFPFCETSFWDVSVLPADCGGSLHFSVDRVIKICW